MSQTAADILDTDTVYVVENSNRTGSIHTDHTCKHLKRAHTYRPHPAASFPESWSRLCLSCEPILAAYGPPVECSVACSPPPDTRSWAYPGCPACESDVFVERNPNQYADYRCAACEALFDSADALDTDELARIRADRDAEIRVEP